MGVRGSRPAAQGPAVSFGQVSWSCRAVPFRVGAFSGSVEARVGTSGTHSSRGRTTNTVIGYVHVCQGSRWRWIGTS